MERLFRGIRKFQKLHYKREQEFFQKISKGQSPDVLFFACSDSRVDPNLITQSKVGELFIVRNVGNIVPANNPFHKKTCTAAAIEFALLVLKVTDIVVCGHSDCGALKALYYDKKDFEDKPNLREWLDTASEVKEDVLSQLKDPSYKKRIEMTEKKYLIRQIENLKTYPLVNEALKEGKINIHGWYYDICTGAVYTYNERRNIFEKIDHNEEEFMGISGGDPCEDMP